MSGSNSLNVAVKADVTDINVKMALAKGAVSLTTAEVNRLGKEAAASGGAISSTLLPALTQATQAQTAARASLAALSSEHRKHGEAVGSNRVAYLEFGHVAKAAFDEIGAGASPLRVLQTEGARLVQAFTELNATTATTVLRFAAVALPIAAVAGALAFLALKAIEAKRAEDDLNNSTAALGRVSEVSSGTTTRMAEQLANRYDLSTAAAAKLVGAVNMLPEATEHTRAALLNLAPAIAAATGEEQTDAVRKLVAGFENYGAVERFAEANRLVTPAISASLDAAVKAKDTFAAQEIVLGALQARFGKYSDQLADYNKQAGFFRSINAAGADENGANNAPQVPQLPRLADTAPEGPSDAQQRADDAQRAADHKTHSESIVEIDDAELKTRLLSAQLFGQAAQKVELSYWQGKLATIKGSGEAEVAARRQITDKVYSLESELHAESLAGAKRADNEALAEARKAAADIATIQRNDLATALQSQTLDLEARKANLQQQVDDGTITADQKAKLEADLVTRLFAIQEQEVTNQEQLLDQTVVQRAAHNNQIVLLEQRKNLELAQLGEEAARADAKIAKQEAAERTTQDREVASSLSQSLVGMLSSRQSFTQQAISLGERLVERELTWGLTELLDTIRTQALKTSATTAGVTAQTAVKATGAAAGAAIEKSAGNALILSRANQAAAGAYNAVVDIPIIGPLLAPIAGGVAFAAVSAFSAAGGVEAVPYDNAPFLLHANETVLPARIAQPLMQLASDPFGALSGGSRSVSNDNSSGDTYHFNFPPGGGRDSPGQFTQAHGEAIISYLQNARRNGRLK